MIEIQCTSCHTRYRIDERVLPEETPTFKCSRCGHVFSTEPRGSKVAAPASPAASPKPAIARSANPPRIARAAVRRAVGQAERASIAPSGQQAPPPGDEPAPPTPSELPKQPPFVSRSSAEQYEPSTAPAQSAVGSMQFGDESSYGVQPETPADAPHATSDRGLEAADFSAFQAGPQEEDPLAKPFAEPALAATGDSLSFDFSEEPGPQPVAEDLEARRADRWEVGEPPAAPEIDPPPRGPSEIEAAEPESARPQAASFSRRSTAPRFDTGALDEMPGRLHSSGFFIAIFAIVAIGFGMLSLLIAGSPSASAEMLAKLPSAGKYFAKPVTSASQVALLDVSAQYRNLKDADKPPALIVSGTAHNVTTAPLHTVQILVRLVDAGGHDVAGQTVYCGNPISIRMIGEMTRRELEFFQRLDPPRDFVLAPDATWKFMVVFSELPQPAGSFRIAVIKAQAAPAGAATAVPRA